MSCQNELADSFKRAIEREQIADTGRTDQYLSSYSPKKLQSFGLAVINLNVTNVREGLGGKTIIELCNDKALQVDGSEIQSGSISVGDIVKLDKMKNANNAELVQKRKAMVNSSTFDKTNSSENLINESLEAVVIKVSSQSICLAINDGEKEDKIMNLYNNTSNDSVRMWIVKLSNSVTYKRMNTTMNKLKELDLGRKNKVIEILLGESTYDPPSESRTERVTFFDSKLNDSQKNAISFAIHDSPLTIIHGPPGTGKTYTLIELIKQLVFHNGERVLVCGPSNISVDLILERLSPNFSSGTEESKKKKTRKVKHSTMDTQKLIRIGHPARLLSKNLKHSLEVLSKGNFDSRASDNKMLLKDIENDIASTLAKIKKCKNYGERRLLWSDIKQYRKELRSRERKIVQDLLVGSKVILSTLHGAGSQELMSLYKDSLLNLSLQNPFFDTIIIDEVSQALEPQCWIPLVNHLGFKRLVIAGDNMQLPPTIMYDALHLEQKLSKLELNKNNEKIADLLETLFDRLIKDLNGKKFKKLLDVQYRLNELIMDFASQSLYEGKLRADLSVKDITLLDFPDVKATDDTEPTCIWYDTEGGDFPERSENDFDVALGGTASKYNDMEALLAIRHTKSLILASLQEDCIGIISPYNAQVSLIKKKLHEAGLDKIEVSSIDGFQGREKEVIIISLVRSNEKREVGFLRDKRRLNVAMTRPKRQLCIVGDLELMHLSNVAYLKSWASYAEERYEIRYPDLENY